jgi:hypothetical protein
VPGGSLLSLGGPVIAVGRSFDACPIVPSFRTALASFRTAFGSNHLTDASLVALGRSFEVCSYLTDRSLYLLLG